MSTDPISPNDNKPIDDPDNYNENVDQEKEADEDLKKKFKGAVRGDSEELPENLSSMLNRPIDGENPEGTPSSKGISGNQVPLASEAAQQAMSSAMQVNPAQIGQAITNAISNIPQLQQAIGASSAAELVSELGTKMLDRIYVSKADQAQDIRLVFKQSILPATEVQVSRTGGQLSVHFMTSSAQSAQLLANAVPQLNNHLGARFSKENINIKVTNSKGIKDTDLPDHLNHLRVQSMDEAEDMDT